MGAHEKYEVEIVVRVHVTAPTSATVEEVAAVARMAVLEGPWQGSDGTGAKAIVIEHCERPEALV